jgi:hypothetical protein
MSFVQPSAEQVLGIHPRALDVTVPTGDVLVPATLNVPVGARAVVAVFAPPGGSRYDAPSAFFAQVLEQSGLATLCLDGLDTLRGDETRRVVDFLRTEAFTAGLPIGLLAFAPGLLLSIPRVSAWLESSSSAPRAAELASEFFVERLLSHRIP